MSADPSEIPVRFQQEPKQCTILTVHGFKKLGSESLSGTSFAGVAGLRTGLRCIILNMVPTSPMTISLYSVEPVMK